MSQIQEVEKKAPPKKAKTQAKTKATSEYQKLLRKALAERKKRNSRYSLRSFAKHLEISHSHLLDVLSGRRSLSLAQAQKVIPKLELSPIQRHLFLESVKGGHLITAATARERLKDVEEPTAFKHWYYIAIITLASIPTLKLNAEKASILLDLSIEECDNAVQTLLRLGFLETTDEGFVKRAANAWDIIRLSDPGQDESLDAYSMQILNVVKNSIDKTPSTERCISSNIFPMNAKQFEALEERVHSLVYDVMAESADLKEGDEQDTVYLVAAQLIPLAHWK